MKRKSYPIPQGIYRNGDSFTFRAPIHSLRQVWSWKFVLIGNLVLGSEVGEKAFGYGRFGFDMGVGFFGMVAFPNAYFPGFGLAHLG